MPVQLLIEEIPLKHFLRLFAPDTSIESLELGDTAHPSSGFVNEAILGEIKTVKQLVDFDYEFEGLVHFQAVIGNLKVQYNSQLYTLIGERKPVDKLISKAKALNANPTLPQYHYRLIQD